jgi:hypothetical protein
MGWQVHGTDSHLSLSVDGSGLSISGIGQHICRPESGTGAYVTDLEILEADWGIYRASDAFKLVDLMGLEVSCMKRYLDPEAVRKTDVPICTINKNPNSIGFSAFLPEKMFEDVLIALKLFQGLQHFSYWMNFEFVGFAPREFPEEAQFISYDSWLSGRPYLCTRDGFSFHLRRRGVDDDCPHRHA